MLGEQFAEPDFVVGMIMKLKPQFDKISIWLRDSRKIDAVQTFKSEMASILQIDENDIEYMVFKDEKEKPAQPK